MPRYNRHALKAVSAILCAVMLLENAPLEASGAESGMAPSASFVTSFMPPLEYSSLKEIHQGSGDEFIIHIQDAHSNFSGQDNLANTLDGILNKYPVSLILVEGSWIEATLDPVKELVPNRAEMRRIARSFLMDGKISGEEYLNLVSDHKMRIMGLEDKEFYMRSVKNYQTLAKRREETLSYLRKIQDVTDKLKRKLYPKELNEYERSKASASKDAGNPKELMALIEEQGGAIVENLPEVQKLQNLGKREKQIDFDAANLEQAALIEELSRRGAEKEIQALAKQTQTSKNSKVSQFALVRELIRLAGKKAVEPSTFAQLSAYEAYLEAFANLDMEQLISELEEAEDKAYLKLLPSQDARTLRAIDRYLGLLKSAYQIQMTTPQFQSFLVNEPDFVTPAYLAFLNRKLAESGFFSDVLILDPVLDEGKVALIDFYRSVDERDMAFMFNAGRFMKEMNQKTAVMITGGYHTEHLTGLFKSKGYSYAVLTPMVTSATNQAKYEKGLLAILGEKKARVVNHVQGETSATKKPLTDLEEEMQHAGKRSKEGVRTAGAVLSGIANQISQAAITSSPEVIEKINDQLGARLSLANPSTPRTREGGFVNFSGNYLVGATIKRAEEPRAAGKEIGNVKVIERFSGLAIVQLEVQYQNESIRFNVLQSDRGDFGELQSDVNNLVKGIEVSNPGLNANEVVLRLMASSNMHLEREARSLPQTKPFGLQSERPISPSIRVQVVQRALQALMYILPENFLTPAESDRLINLAQRLQGQTISKNQLVADVGAVVNDAGRANAVVQSAFQAFETDAKFNRSNPTEKELRTLISSFTRNGSEKLFTAEGRERIVAEALWNAVDNSAMPKEPTLKNDAALEKALIFHLVNHVENYQPFVDWILAIADAPEGEMKFRNEENLATIQPQAVPQVATQLKPIGGAAPAKIDSRTRVAPEGWAGEMVSVLELAPVKGPLDSRSAWQSYTVYIRLYDEKKNEISESIFDIKALPNQGKEIENTVNYYAFKISQEAKDRLTTADLAKGVLAALQRDGLFGEAGEFTTLTKAGSFGARLASQEDGSGFKPYQFGTRAGTHGGNILSVSRSSVDPRWWNTSYGLFYSLARNYPPFAEKFGIRAITKDGEEIIEWPDNAEMKEIMKQLGLGMSIELAGMVSERDYMALVARKIIPVTVEDENSMVYRNDIFEHFFGYLFMEATPKTSAYVAMIADATIKISDWNTLLDDGGIDLQDITRGFEWGTPAVGAIFMGKSKIDPKRIEYVTELFSRSQQEVVRDAAVNYLSQKKENNPLRETDPIVKSLAPGFSLEKRKALVADGTKNLSQNEQIFWSQLIDYFHRLTPEGLSRTDIDTLVRTVEAALDGDALPTVNPAVSGVEGLEVKELDPNDSLNDLFNIPETTKSSLSASLASFEDGKGFRSLVVGYDPAESEKNKITEMVDYETSYNARDVIVVYADGDTKEIKGGTPISSPDDLLDANHQNFGQIRHVRPVGLFREKLKDWMDESPEFTIALIHDGATPTLVEIIPTDESKVVFEFSERANRALLNLRSPELKVNIEPTPESPEDVQNVKVALQSQKSNEIARLNASFKNNSIPVDQIDGIYKASFPTSLDPSGARLATGREVSESNRGSSVYNPAFARVTGGGINGDAEQNRTQRDASVKKETVNRMLLRDLAQLIANLVKDLRSQGIVLLADALSGLNLRTSSEEIMSYIDRVEVEQAKLGNALAPDLSRRLSEVSDQARLLTRNAPSAEKIEIGLSGNNSRKNELRVLVGGVDGVVDGLGLSGVYKDDFGNPVSIISSNYSLNAFYKTEQRIPSALVLVSKSPAKPSIYIPLDGASAPFDLASLIERQRLDESPSGSVATVKDRVQTHRVEGSIYSTGDKMVILSTSGARLASLREQRAYPNSIVDNVNRFPTTFSAMQPGLNRANMSKINNLLRSSMARTVGFTKMDTDTVSQFADLADTIKNIYSDIDVSPDVKITQETKDGLIFLINQFYILAAGQGASAKVLDVAGQLGLDAPTIRGTDGLMLKDWEGLSDQDMQKIFGEGIKGLKPLVLFSLLSAGKKEPVAFVFASQPSFLGDVTQRAIVMGMSGVGELPLAALKTELGVEEIFTADTGDVTFRFNPISNSILFVSSVTPSFAKAPEGSRLATAPEAPVKSSAKSILETNDAKLPTELMRSASDLESMKNFIALIIASSGREEGVVPLAADNKFAGLIFGEKDSNGTVRVDLVDPRDSATKFATFDITDSDVVGAKSGAHTKITKDALLDIWTQEAVQAARDEKAINSLSMRLFKDFALRSAGVQHVALSILVEGQDAVRLADSVKSLREEIRQINTRSENPIYVYFQFLDINGKILDNFQELPSDTIPDLAAGSLKKILNGTLNNESVDMARAIASGYFPSEKLPDANSNLINVIPNKAGMLTSIVIAIADQKDAIALRMVQTVTKNPGVVASDMGILKKVPVDATAKTYEEKKLFVRALAALTETLYQAYTTLITTGSSA